MILKKRRVLLTFSTLLTALALWFCYDFFFYDIINNYQKQKTEKRLIENFEKNSAVFDKIDSLKPNLGEIFDLKFHDYQDFIQFRIQSDSANINQWDIRTLTLDEENLPLWKFYFLNKTTSLFGMHDEEIFMIPKPWTINFSESRTHSTGLALLAIQNYKLEDLEQIEEILRESNCLAFEKNDSVIKLRFAGHQMDNFNYILPLPGIEPHPKWKKLSHQWFYLCQQSGLYCGETDW